MIHQRLTQCTLLLDSFIRGTWVAEVKTCVSMHACVDIGHLFKASITGSLVLAILDEMTAKENGSLPQEKIHMYSAVSCVVPHM